MVMHNFRRGLKVGDLTKSLHLAKPRSYPELVAKASQFMLLEDAESSPPSVFGAKKEKKRKHRGDERSPTTMHMAKGRGRDEGKPRHVQQQRHFSRPLPEVYAATVKQDWVRPARPKPTPLTGVDPDNYCEFHRNYGHRLHRCRALNPA
ncbi:hypothetical protein AXF42_Ash019343 [Apostasia shenzhenica]|uniref:Uncharacterized protein n=1 Tax=Apostasia shenzhenica TaxID=1088818 RepID=A0A2H9ZTH8_9ASPA|nr:hypothetical protein AXF42_Ash019343 [Apostasia shenzhenica]